MRFRTLTFLMVSLSSLVATLPLHAQLPAPTAQELKMRADIREKRVDLLRGKIKPIDSRIETRLDVIVDTLQSIGGSKDSRTSESALAATATR